MKKINKFRYIVSDHMQSNEIKQITYFKQKK